MATPDGQDEGSTSVDLGSLFSQAVTELQGGADREPSLWRLALRAEAAEIHTHAPAARNEFHQRISTWITATTSRLPQPRPPWIVLLASPDSAAAVKQAVSDRTWQQMTSASREVETLTQFPSSPPTPPPLAFASFNGNSDSRLMTAVADAIQDHLHALNASGQELVEDFDAATAALQVLATRPGPPTDLTMRHPFHTATTTVTDFSARLFELYRAVRVGLPGNVDYQFIAAWWHAGVRGGAAALNAAHAIEDHVLGTRRATWWARMAIAAAAQRIAAHAEHLHSNLHPRGDPGHRRVVMALAATARAFADERLPALRTEGRTLAPTARYRSTEQLQRARADIDTTLLTWLGSTGGKKSFVGHPRQVNALINTWRLANHTATDLTAGPLLREAHHFCRLAQQARQLDIQTRSSSAARTSERSELQRLCDQAANHAGRTASGSGGTHFALVMIEHASNPPSPRVPPTTTRSVHARSVTPPAWSHPSTAMTGRGGTSR